MSAPARHPSAQDLKLLDRDSFREDVLARDGGACVVCGIVSADGVRLDVHHLLERRLFPDGGYYLDNGVTLCDRGRADGSCHLRAERTLLAVEELREKAGITRVVLPPGFDDDAVYTKWGDQVHSDGTRSPGPLFHEEPVQKVLAAAGKLDLYRRHFKHPRTLHAPWSPNRGADGDHQIEDFSGFAGREVVLTLKVDGENTSMTRDRVHARSVNSGYHPTRTWVTQLHGRIAHELPEGWRVVGENMYGRHSIAYTDLPSYFLVFAIFDETNTCLSWDDTVEWANLLGLDTVPVLYRGPWDRDLIEELEPGSFFGGEPEGYVCRLADSFSYHEWHRSAFKSVRKDHVKTDQHWLHGEVPANGLAGRSG